MKTKTQDSKDKRKARNRRYYLKRKAMEKDAATSCQGRSFADLTANYAHMSPDGLERECQHVREQFGFFEDLETPLDYDHRATARDLHDVDSAKREVEEKLRKLGYFRQKGSKIVSE